MAPSTVVFALVYGVFVDGFRSILKVKSSHVLAEARTLVVWVILGTAAVGLIPYYTAVYALRLPAETQR